MSDTDAAETDTAETTAETETDTAEAAPEAETGTAGTPNDKTDEQDDSDTESGDADTPSDPRLQALDEGIAKVKQDLEDLTRETDEPLFIQKGSKSENVDDTIAPPG
jgi:hypothetical protein